MRAFHLASVIALACGAHSIGAAQASPDSDVFAMRGLPLGSTIQEFRDFPIPNDDGKSTALQTWWSSDTDPERKQIRVLENDAQAGVIECKWYSKRSYLPRFSADEHWIDLGSGKGSPTFRFIDIGSGPVLFEVTFFANIEYYGGIYDALTANYGKPEETSSPFKTRLGGNFSSTVSAWHNSQSSIVLKSRCRHLERYCLDFKHSDLSNIYAGRIQAQEAKAQSKI